MKNTLILVHVLMLPTTLLSQWNTEQPFKNLINEVNNFYKEHNISDTSINFDYSLIIGYAQEFIDHNLEEIQTVKGLMNKSQADSTNFSIYKKAISNLSRITNQYQHNYYENNKDEFIYLYKNSLFQKLNKDEKYHLYYILGQCKLDDSIKKCLLSEIDLPLIVKAKLNDGQAIDSILQRFLREYLDTINYDEPEQEILADLLYLNNEPAFSAINKVLSSNHVIYKEIDTTGSSFIHEILPWDIISVNEYLYSELSALYRYEIRFLKSLTYNRLKDKNERLATLLYAQTLENYLTNKFNNKFTVTFKKNILIDESYYVPPPSLYNNEEYIRKYIYAFYKLINITYEEAKQQVLNNWKAYHNQN